MQNATQTEPNVKPVDKMSLREMSEEITKLRADVSRLQEINTKLTEESGKFQTRLADNLKTVGEKASRGALAILAESGHPSPIENIKGQDEGEPIDQAHAAHMKRLNRFHGNR